MANEYKLSYTAAEIDERLGRIDELDSFATFDYVDEATTIKDYEEIVSLPLTITEDTIYYHYNQAFSHELAFCGKTSVTAGEIIDVTGYQWANTAFPIYMFYDAAGNVLTYKAGDGSNTAITINDVTVPNGAATILINGRDGNEIAVFKKNVANYTMSEVLTHIKELEENITNYATFDYVDSNTLVKEEYDDYEYPLTVTNGKIKYLSGTGVFNHENGIYAETEVTAGDKLIITGWQWALESLPTYIFYDAAGEVVSSYVHTTLDTRIIDLAVEVPEGATKLLVNGRINATDARYNYPPKVTGTYHKTYNMQELLEITKELEAADKEIYNHIEEVTNIEKSYPASELPLTITEGQLKWANNTIFNHSYGKYATADVIVGQKLTISAYQWRNTAFPIYMFLNTAGEVVSYYHTGEEADKTITINNVIVPDNAASILINGHTNYPLSIIGEHTKKYNLITVVDEIDSIKETLNNTVKPKLITLGDSITMLGTGDRGWVKYFIEKTNCELIANTAMNSAVLSDYSNTEYDGNPQQDNQTNNVLGNQVQKIINNAYEAPDIILIAIGTNGGIDITVEDMSATYYDDTNTLIPLENVDRTTNAGAFRYVQDTLHNLYPNTIIFWCAPIMGYQSTRSAENAMKYAESLRIATEYTGQLMIDTNRCGINGVNEVSGTNGQYLIDGLHPNVNGAKKIGYYNASKVKPFLENIFELS